MYRKVKVNMLYADCSIAEQNPYIGKTLVQKHGDKYLIQNPPMPPPETDELDEVYALPYMKNYHPMYEKDVFLQYRKLNFACRKQRLFRKL